MNTAIIIVLYKTPGKEQSRLRQEMNNVGIKNIYFIDNSHTKLGYAFGVNQGIKLALKNRAKIIFLANPDISVKGLTLQQLLEVTKYFDVAGYLMNQQGKNYYGGELDKWRMSGGLITRKPNKRFVDCDFVSGSLMMINRNVIDRVGLLDESYGMYYEDVDFCIRARKAGCKVGIDTHFVYEHFENSAGSIMKEKFLFRNRWKILWKYGSFRQKLYELLRLPKTIIEFLLIN